MKNRLGAAFAWAERRLIELILETVERRDAALTAGFRIEDWNALDEMQHSRCAICLEKRYMQLRPDFARNGYVRGLLCAACRYGLAHFREDPVRLRRAAMYLEEKPGQRRLKFRR